MTSRVLVTGGAGFIGAKLVPMLLDDGYEVRVLDNLMYNQHSLIECFTYDGFEFIKGDVRDKDVIEDAVTDVDYIVNLAAIVGAPACERNRELARKVNYEAVAQLDELRDDDTGIIMASTGSVYGKIEGICTEERKPDPLSWYGETKFEAEQELLGSGNVVVYRPATAFGLSNRLRLDLLINDFTYQAVKNGFLVLYERHNMRTFIDVADLARAMKFAVENYDEMCGEVYNVGNEDLNFTKKEICEIIQDHVDYTIHYTDEYSDPEARDYEVSYQKLRNIGFDTEVSIHEGIQQLVDAYEMVQVKNPYSNYQG